MWVILAPRGALMMAVAASSAAELTSTQSLDQYTAPAVAPVAATAAREVPEMTRCGTDLFVICCVRRREGGEQEDGRQQHRVRK